ncbi:MAG: DUF84 family protein [Myxococcota bacterium]|nr:DUF84 family protein [Myxococcales bacterium]
MTAGQRALAGVRRVRVGSANEPKVEAVRRAVAAYAPDARVLGAAVASGVPEQPVGFPEIARGARTRARAAFDLGGCELAVGYEDGLVELDLGSDGGIERLNVGCAAVTDGVRMAIGLSSGFAYPPAVAERAARERLPVGDLFDALWRERFPREGAPEDAPSARGEGNIGKLSAGALPRSEYARHAVVCALVRFLHPGVYERSGAEGARGTA